MLITEPISAFINFLYNIVMLGGQLLILAAPFFALFVFIKHVMEHYSTKQIFIGAFLVVLLTLIGARVAVTAYAMWLGLH